MKQLLLLFLFAGFTLPGFSQYGKLEPIADGDTTIMVLRTSKETLTKLTSSAEKKDRKLGSSIASLERQLDMLRAEYNLGRSTVANMTFIVNAIKRLESLGLDVSNYIQEALAYSKQGGKNSVY